MTTKTKKSPAKSAKPPVKRAKQVKTRELKPLEKAKRTRRTKAEMDAFRAARARWKVRDALYLQGNTNRAICPDCFSRPSVFRDAAAEAADTSGWSMAPTKEKVQIGGSKHVVSTGIFPCSNPDCFTAIRVRYIAALFIYHAKAVMDAPTAKKYNAGSLTQKGVWHPIPTPVAPSPSPRVEVKPPVRRKRSRA